jgi:FtsZ-interacting cell division protein ZipA
MPLWLWGLIVAGALVLIVLVVLAVTKGRELQRDRKRREAERLRMEAERKLAGAEQSERTAEQAGESVTKERAEADRLQREAEARRARAEELEEIAEHEAQRAREQRTAAEVTARKAQSVDPLAPYQGDRFDIDEALGRGNGPDPVATEGALEGSAEGDSPVTEDPPSSVDDDRPR